jgi:LPS export ABC transporter protein LptC|tara:strand:+ start:1620 stop:2195 length:576 start_codon:yes stop_codon:yes gene_type:complete
VNIRKRKIIFFQFFLFVISTLIVYFFYFNKDKVENIEVENIKTAEDESSNVFNDIEYSGFDLNGNRYYLFSSEAIFDSEKPEIVNMKDVLARFTFKDGSILIVRSKTGLFNNKSLDMFFTENVNSEYNKHKLYSNNIDYLNTKSLLKVYGNVNGSGPKGKINAENLNFDLKNKTLDISAIENSQVNVNLVN